MNYLFGSLRIYDHMKMFLDGLLIYSLRSTTNLQGQLEGVYIDLQDYMIYPSIENEQVCTFFYYVHICYSSINSHERMFDQDVQETPVALCM